MTEPAYELRSGREAYDALAGLDAHTRNRVMAILSRMIGDLANVLTDEGVTRISDQEILGKTDPNLAFYALQDDDIEIGFYVDRKDRTITLTSILQSPTKRRRSG